MNSIKPPSGRVTLLFTDIEDSSRMTNALGEVYRESLLREHNHRIRAASAAHNGYIVKTIGDSFMLGFQDAQDAIRCASAIQEAMSKPALTATDSEGKTWTIKVRIGVHQALELLEPRSSPECPADYMGSDVNFAARVESLGAGGQILVSDPTHQAAKFGTPDQWRAWPHRRIKSFEQPETVWEFLWDGQSRGEPGSRFLPVWFKGEQNRYIPRPELESAVLAHFGKLRPDGSVPRLVTLHAYGGMGKTRLAVACAIQTAGAFKDGVYFVRLDDKPPTVPAVAEAIGASLGLAPETALPAKVLAALSDKDLLLLLDNYESVDSEDVQTFLIELLKGTLAVRLLVTGREAVKLSDVEQEVSLDEGMTEAEAEALFLARARLKHQQGPQWQPDQAEESAIRRVVRMSERIPVAIELAAAWVSHSTVKEIADGIEATPLGSESKEPPRSGRIDQALRHRSLTRSLNYSYERLEPEARDGLVRLGLFAGSFDPDSVAAASGVRKAKDLLFRLQDASLLHRIESNGRSRFTMLRPTRAYAAEKFDALPEAASLRQQFVRYYRDTATQKRRLTGPSKEPSAKVAALDWFEEEWQNLLAAAKLASEMKDGKTVADISAAVADFWGIRGHWSEVEELYNLALQASRDFKDRRAEGLALQNLGTVYMSQKRWAEAQQAFQESLAAHREFKNRFNEGQILACLGSIYDWQARWAEAVQAYQQSIGIYREFKDRYSEGQALNNLGNVYQGQGHWAEAEKAYQQSLGIMQEFKDRHGEGKVRHSLGSVYFSQGQWAKADQAYQQSLAIIREFKDRHTEGLTLQNLGNVYQMQTQRGKAEEAYRQSLGIYREFKDRHGEGLILNNLGIIYKDQRRWAEAEQAFLQCLAIQREFKDRHGEARPLENLGMVYRAQGRRAEAEHAFQQSLAIKREFKDRHGEGDIFNDLGNLYKDLGRWREAEGAFEQSLAIDREFKDHRGEGITLSNLGSAYKAEGQCAKAEEAFQQALAICRELKDRHGEGSALNHLGEVYKEQRRWAEAEQAHQHSLAIYREFKDRDGEGLALGDLGGLHYEQGHRAEAEKFYLQALAFFREVNDRLSEGKALGNLGIVYQDQGRWAEAEKAYEQDLAICREFNDRSGEGKVLNNLGNVYHDQRRWAEAEKAYQQSLAIYRALNDRRREGRTLNNLGNDYLLQGRWAEAEEAYQQCLPIYREFKDRHGEGCCLYNLTLVKITQKDIHAALGFVREALTALETTEDKPQIEKARDTLKWLEALPS